MFISSSVLPSSVAFSNSVSSTWTTALADKGTAAPVLMRMHSPSAISLLSCTAITNTINNQYTNIT